MHTPNVPNREPDPRVRLPRWVALISWPVLFLLVHVAAPWAISLLSTRHGWTQGRPGRRNRLALLLVGAGTVVVSWCVGLHFGANTGLLEMERTPRSLLVRGPYWFTRNPLFLSELAIWLGPLLRQRRGLCWMSDLLGVRDENGGLREKFFSKIVSACFSSQSWARFMIQTRHYIEEMTMSPVQLNQSGSPPTGESLWLQMRETGQPGSRTTHFYDARPIRPFLGQGTAGMELGVMKRILLLKDKMPIKP